MNKKRVIFLFCVAALIASTFALGKQAQTIHPSAHQVTQQSDSPVPEHVSYEFLFRRAAFFKKKVAEAGKPQTRDKMFQQEANISAAQANALDEIAAGCLREVDEQDARARVIIEAFRARYPDGIVPRGEKLPPPPPELKGMQVERDAMVLRGRDRLRAAFGEQEFGRFHEFVMKRFAGKGIGKEQR